MEQARRPESVLVVIYTSAGEFLLIERRDTAAQAVSRYYVRLSVVDKPGTLAKITAILAQGKIGIASVIQPEGHEGESVPLILMLHQAPNSAMRKALAKITKLPVVKAAPVMIRVENLK